MQRPLLWQEPEGNRNSLEALIRPLARSTDLVVLPETFTTGFCMEPERAAEDAGGPTCLWLRRLAQQCDLAIVGSVLTREQGRYHNRLLWADAAGEVRHYDKRHLFRMGREHEHFTPGRSAITLSWRGFRICPLVCYDLRFPVYSRRRSELDYDLLIYVANWPAARRLPWSTLLRARAIENQCYVVGVNRVGPDGNGIEHAGDSAAIDFTGQTLADLGSAAAAETVTLSLEALERFRQKFPAHLDADRFTLEL